MKIAQMTASERWQRLAGAPPFSRMVLTHACSSAADAAVAVSLAGSIFFSVSADAARPRVLLYLALTMAPFAVLAPLLGPLIDRVRGGHWVTLVALCFTRSALALALASQLRTLLFFPIAFGLLVLGKAYSVTKSALIPRLVERPERLVWSNARMSLFGSAGGAIGGGSAAAVYALGGSAWSVRFAAAVFVVAGVFALRSRPTTPAPERVVPAAEVIELHSRPLETAALAMTVLRAAVGYLAFMLAFVLKRSGEPPWMYGLVLVAAGAAGFTATLVAAPLRRWRAERALIALAMVVPTAAALVAAIQFGRIAVALAAASVGFGAALGRHGFDSLAQIHTPDTNRARAFAAFETRFQLAWVIGALVAVLLQPSGEVGLVVLAAGLAVGAVVLVARERRELSDAVLRRASPPEELLALASSLHLAGSHVAAVINAAAAVQALPAAGRVVAAGELAWAADLHRLAVSGKVDEQASARSVSWARSVLQRSAGTPQPPTTVQAPPASATVTDPGRPASGDR